MIKQSTRRLAIAGAATAVATTAFAGAASAAPAGFPNGPQCDPGSDAVVMVETAQSYAMICRFGGDGHTYYKGTGKLSGQTLVTSDVTSSADYGASMAHNEGYSYILQRQGLKILDPNGIQISFEPAVYSWPN